MIYGKINIKEYFSSNATADALMLSPLFSGYDFNDDIPPLHHSYKGYYLVSNLPLSDFFKKVLISHNITDIKHLLFSNYINFLFLLKVNLLDNP